jgi:predicted acyltransferase
MAPNDFNSFLQAQLQHVKWEGFHFLELVFPLFLFLVGISTVFSLGKLVAGGVPGCARPYLSWPTTPNTGWSS